MNLNEEELQRALVFFSAEKTTVKKGTVLKQPSCILPFFGFVLSGSIQVYLDDIDGNSLLLANVGSGKSFGESLCYLKQETDIYIKASADTVFYRLYAESLRKNAFPDPFEARLVQRFLSILSKRTLEMNSRIQVLSKPSIREKIITFLSQEKGENGTYLFSMNREDMAAYLGVNRSALSRELSRMKKEGLLDYHKNTFRIL